MALTNDQLLDRIEAIETALNTIQTALNNLATKRELKTTLAVITEAGAESSSLETRVDAIETTLNDVQTSLNNVATRRQLNSLLSLRQADITNLQTRVTTLESEMDILQARIASEE